MPRRALPRHAFTLIEAAVALGVIAILFAALLPALAGAREAARTAHCAANLHAFAPALALFASDNDGRLPQHYTDFGGGSAYHVGVAFGGRAGSLNLLGLDTLGPDQRPLNPYLSSADPEHPAEIFRDPADRGGADPFLAAPEPSPDTLLVQVGNSYTLNGAGIDDNPCPFVDMYPTLALGPGKRPPRIASPARTWVVGDLPIVNFDDAGDRGYRWHAARRGQTRANLLFADGHAGALLTVPDPRSAPGGLRAANSTPDFTYLADEAQAPPDLQPPR